MMTVFKNSDIISLNETHLGHSDTLTPDMMGISKDVLIICCDHNNRGGGVALTVNKNQIQNRSELKQF